MLIPSTCSACTFVGAQLGSATPCPWHAGVDYVGQTRAASPGTVVCVRPTADQPWPFTPREYARLLLLRSRVDRRAQLGLRPLN